MKILTTNSGNKIKFPRALKFAAAVLATSLLALILMRGSASAQSPTAAPPAKSQSAAAPKSADAASHVDLAKTPTLYVVNYAHLDTEWRWEYPQTIQEYLTKTMRNNFALFQKYPHYVFNFTGANRYMFMKEYDPQDYRRAEKICRRGTLVSSRLFHGRK